MKKPLHAKSITEHSFSIAIRYLFCEMHAPRTCFNLLIYASRQSFTKILSKSGFGIYSITFT